MAEFKGKGLPTKQTKGALGDVYLDKDTNKKYKCTGSYSITTHANLNKEYEWKEINVISDSVREKINTHNKNKVDKVQENTNDKTKNSAGLNFDKTFEKVKENTTEEVKNQSTVNNIKENKDNKHNSNYNKYYKK